MGLLGNGCKNVDGFGLNFIDGICVFKNCCLILYLYFKDDVGIVFGCNIGSNYEVVFCFYGFVLEFEEVIWEIVDWVLY